MKLYSLKILVIGASIFSVFMSSEYLENELNKPLNKSNIELTEVPDFEVKLLDSEKTLSNKDLLDKYTLITIWSTTCGICVRDVPLLEDVNEKYIGSNFEIVSLSLSEKEAVQKFRKDRYSMPWKHVIIEGGWEGELAEAFKVRGTPTYYLASPAGKILATKKDFQTKESFSKILDRYLK